MTIPTAEQLETTFLQAGQIRKRNPKYANDSGYWTGGMCDWGGQHTLKEDCREVVKGFGKMVSLDQVSDELKRCTNKSEYDDKKADYLRKCNETLSSLSNSSATSCMFGICCIWSDDNMGQNIQRFIEQAKNGISGFKSNLNNFTHQNVEKINQIEMEILKIEEQMRQNEQKAMNEKDPVKKLALIALIEEDGKKLRSKQAELAQLENRLNFNADKYVNDMIRAMKEAIEGRTGGGGANNNNRTPRNPRTPNNTNNSNPNNFGSEDEADTDSNNPQFRRNPNAPKQNNQLFIYGVIALIVIYFLMNQKESKEYDY